MYLVFAVIAFLILAAAACIAASLWNLRRSRWSALQRQFPEKRARPGAPTGMAVAELPAGKRYSVRWTLDDRMLHLRPEHSDQSRISFDYFHRPLSLPLESLEGDAGAGGGTIAARPGGVPMTIKSPALRLRIEPTLAARRESSAPVGA